ncbi:MAG: hypothetical protein HUJ65_01965 [Oscillospiraceae bacterium]|nr:hypothetical protein [Oscillospiraceae bacterium]
MVDIKKLKPVGVVLILAFAVIGIILCLTADLGIPEPYTPEHDASYYSSGAETMRELRDEFGEHVFPQLEGITEYHFDENTMKIVVSVEKKYMSRVELALSRDIDISLFTLVEV